MTVNVVFLWLSALWLLFFEVVLDFMIFTLAFDVMRDGNEEDVITWITVTAATVLKLGIAYVINEVRLVIDWHNIIGTLPCAIVVITILDVCLFVVAEIVAHRGVSQ
jgi:hypothetical protein